MSKQLTLRYLKDILQRLSVSESLEKASVLVDGRPVEKVELVHSYTVEPTSENGVSKLNGSVNIIISTGEMK